MDFEIVGEITQIETIARGGGVRDYARLRRQYGQGRWRKRIMSCKNRFKVPRETEFLQETRFLLHDFLT